MKKNQVEKKAYQILTADSIETLDDFIVSVMACTVSLKSMESYQVTAFRKGLLDEDAQEVSKTICWEIQRLMALYQKLVELIQEISPVNEKQILKQLKKYIPELDKNENK